ncbi:UNVERIFIED_CONTAM: hypothetical protein K2H54_048655 [Gekko kuhli]
MGQPGRYGPQNRLHQNCHQTIQKKQSEEEQAQENLAVLASWMSTELDAQMAEEKKYRSSTPMSSVLNGVPMSDDAVAMSNDVAAELTPPMQSMSVDSMLLMARYWRPMPRKPALKT